MPLLFLPALIAALAASKFGESDALHALWEVFCLSIAVVGLSLRALTVGFVPARTSGRNVDQQLAEVLNVTGIYSIVRHPLYLGNFLIWLGVALFAQTWWLVVLAILSFSVYYERIMLAEEEFLRQRFGKEFEEWATRTPAFTPAISHWIPSDLPFSWRTVLSRENSTMLATVATFFLLEVTGDYFAGEMPHVDLAWALLVGTAVVTYGVLRWMKKHNLLSVEGR